MSEFEFTFGGRRYRVVESFDAGSALSAARRLRVLADWLGIGPPGEDPTRIEDGWRMSDVLSLVERENDDGTREHMAHDELLHDDLEDMRDAVALFEHAASCVALAQLDALPVDHCWKA